MSDEWYRRKVWTDENREEFFTRLRRSRTAYHKAQYVRIQAAELLATGKREAYVTALELLDLILKDWPEEAGVVVHYHRAQCFRGLDDISRAIESYRQIFFIQRRDRRGVFTAPHLDFGWMVATTPMPEFYDEVLGLLVEFADYTFPVERYRANAIAALISADCGQDQQARTHARKALEEAAVEHSGFRYHAKHGLVESPDEKVYERLQELAA
jgi:hypothetical protein